METILMSKIDHQIVISKISIEKSFYFEIELLYPYEGFKNEFFDENVDFTNPQNFKKISIAIEALFKAYSSIIKNRDYLADEYKKRTIYKHLSPMARYYLLKRDNEMRTFFEKKVLDNISIKDLSRSAQNNITDNIVYTVINRKINFGIVDPEKCINIILNAINGMQQEFNSQIGERFSSKRLFRILLPEAVISLKTLSLVYNSDEMILNCTYLVSQEEYFEKDPEKIAFLLRHTEYGIRPEIDDEYLKKMEGQKIAILTKNWLHSQDFSLDFYTVENGKLNHFYAFNNLYLEDSEERKKRFNDLKDFDKSKLFHKMINGEKTEYDDLLRQWWQNRY